MKPTNPTLNALLASRQFLAIDAYRITLANGTSLYYCNGQTDIKFGGQTYSSGTANGGPYFDRSANKAKITWKTGVGTDQLVIDVIPGNATVLGVPMLWAIRFGFFDGADFILYRAFMPTYGNTAAGLVLMFRGRMAEIDAGRSLTTWTVNDYRELLSQDLPRNLFAASCVNTFGDASCGVNEPSLGVNSTVTAGSSPTAINCALTQATGFFNQGKITFTSGNNDGLTYTVSSSTLAGGVNTIVPVAPLVTPPATGDTFTIFPGCDRTLGPNGCPKYANTANYRGFPYIPAPETAV